MINIKNLQKTFGKNEVLKGIDLEIEAGEVVVIIGPSGSGKSTFLRCLNQLEEASSGDIIIDGANLTDKNTDINQVRQHIGMVFQHFNLFPHLSILENIVLAPTDLGRLSKDEAEKKALELLERVGLADKKDAYPDSLSGGQKQRVCIARALVNNPQIIFADEPTGNLDSATGKKIEELLFDLNKNKGITLIIVTHDPDLAARCDRQVHVRDGLIVGGDE